MSERNFWLLLITGCALIVAGTALLLLPGVTYAQDLPGGDYIGSRDCGSCHRDAVRNHADTIHSRTLQDVSRDQDGIIADFEQGEDLRMMTFPGEDTARAFTADDIAYTVGAGRNIQRYVYEAERGVFRLLPAEWDVNAGAWKPYLPAPVHDDPAYDFIQNCAYCHVTDLDVERARWSEDGVQCETCHGPGEEHADLARDAGRRPSTEEIVAVRASINLSVDAQACRLCHSRGTSVHGQPFPVDFEPDMTIDEASEPAMPEDSAHFWPTGHAAQINMQYNEWLVSGHPRALTNVTENDFKRDECLRCHSADYAFNARFNAEIEDGTRDGQPREAITVDTAQFGVTCTSCHDPHSQEGHISNLVQEPYELCVSCHSQAAYGSERLHHPVQEMYEGKALVEGIEPVPGSHFVTDNSPDCLTCHMPIVPTAEGERISHSNGMVMPGQTLNVEALTDTCSLCHEEQATPELLQLLIDDIQTETRDRIAAARALITDATPAWVGQALDVVEQDRSFGIHNYAYADALLDQAETELGLFEAGQ
jgi:predicted CXXCH cytochrome family protein